MIRSRLWSMLASVLLTAPAEAAPAPKGNDAGNGPAFSGQLRSMDDISKLFKTGLKTWVDPKTFASVERWMQKELDPKIATDAGYARDRPFGIYGWVDTAVLKGDLKGTTVVVMIPLSSEEIFIKNLRMSADIDEPKDGVYRISLDQTGDMVWHLRVSGGYGYLALGRAEWLDKDRLLDPKDVISATETAPLAFSIRIDRIPADFKSACMGFLESQVALQKPALPPSENLAAAYDALTALGLRWTRSIFDDGKEFTYRADLDAKSDAPFSEVYTLEAKPDSRLAKDIAGRKPTESRFASLRGKDDLFCVTLRDPLFTPELRTAAVALMAYGLEANETELGEQPAEVSAMIKTVVETLKRTVLKGQTDLVIRGTLTGTKRKQLTLGAAIHLDKGADIDTAFQVLMATAPQKIQQSLSLKAGKIEGETYHTIQIPDADEQSQKLFGEDDKAYFSFGKEVSAVTFGVNAKEMLGSMYKTEPGPAPVMEGIGAVEQFQNWVKGDPELMQIFDPVLRIQRKRAVGFSVEIEGGPKLTIRSRGLIAGPCSQAIVIIAEADRLEQRNRNLKPLRKIED